MYVTCEWIEGKNDEVEYEGAVEDDVAPQRHVAGDAEQRGIISTQINTITLNCCKNKTSLIIMSVFKYDKAVVMKC